MSKKIVRVKLCWLLLMISFVVCASGACAQTIVLWPAGAPGALGQEPTDIPTLTPYLPPKEKATGAAIIVCPGGGYTHLADHEGRPVAEWLNTIGVTAFVLKYRLGPRYHHPAMLQDAARAIRTVRALRSGGLTRSGSVSSVSRPAAISPRPPAHISMPASRMQRT